MHTLSQLTIPPKYELRIARTRNQLQSAMELRAMRYGEKLPELTPLLREDDPVDFRPDAYTVVCTEVASNVIVGSVRFILNVNGTLPLEQSFKLPEEISSQRLCEPQRLVIARKVDAPYVKSLLYKALYLFCVGMQAKWIIACARKPLNREYESLYFADMTDGAGFIPLRNGMGIPHKILGIEVNEIRSIWIKNSHPLADFFFSKTHPELCLYEPLAPEWTRPRVRKQRYERANDPPFQN